MEIYGRIFENPRLVFLQLVTNGVVAGANGDVLGATNPAKIVSSKTTVSESMKVAILLDGVNGQKYKNLKDYSEKNLYKVIYNYGTTVERAIHLLNTYKSSLSTPRRG